MLGQYNIQKWSNRPICFLQAPELKEVLNLIVTPVSLMSHHLSSLLHKYTSTLYMSVVFFFLNGM